MNDQYKTKQALIEELATLRKKITALEQVKSGAIPIEQTHQQHTGGSERDSSAPSKILVSGINVAWDDIKGTCTFEDLPVAMMWVDTTLAGLMSGVQAMVGTERFFLALQSEGRKSVETDWQVISQYPDFRDGFKAIANIAAVAGWGHWELTSLNAERRECHFRIKDSWEGCYQKSLEVCWGSGMLAGKMAGYCTKLFGTNCWADQTHFIAKGDNYDEFFVKPSPRVIESEIEKLLASDEATRADMAVVLKKLEKEIAERKQAELVLRDSEELYRNVFENHAAVKLLIDPDTGNIVEANKAAERYYGWSFGRLKQMKIQEINTLPPEEVEREIEKIRTRKRNHFEFRHRLADGSIRDVEVFSSKIKTKGKELLHSIVYDITKRKQSERELRAKHEELNAAYQRLAAYDKELARNYEELSESQRALRESEERYRTLIEISPDPILMYDLSGKILMVNAETARVYGASSVEEFISEVKTVFDPLTEEGKAFAEASFRKILTDNMPQKDEYSIQLRNGAIITVEINSSIVKSATGEPLAFISVVRDISERKQAEDKLRNSEERIRLLLENANEGIFITQDNIVKFPNKKTVETIGYTAEELARIPFAQYIHPEDCNMVFERQMKHLHGESLPPAYTFRAITKLGQELLLEINVVRTDWEGRRANLNFIRDVTGQLKLEMSWKKADFIINSAKELMTLVNRHYIYEAVNNAYCNAHGKPREEILGKSIEEIWGEHKFHRLIKPIIDQSFKGEIITDGDWIDFTHLGRRYFTVTYYPYCQANDKVSHVSIISHDITDRIMAENSLKIREQELELHTKELEEANTALRVFFKQQSEEQKITDEKLQLNVNELVLPYVKKLQKQKIEKQSMVYLELLEANLNNIVSPFMRNLSAAYQSLTPQEMQIAEMIRQGKRSKEIAAVLNLSIATVKTHRNNIRKKANLRNQGTNLRSYLLSLS